MSEKRAFNKSCDVFALITLVYTLVYIFFNVLPDIGKDKEEQENLTVLDHLSYRKGSLYSFINTVRNITSKQTHFKFPF